MTCSAPSAMKHPPSRNSSLHRKPLVRRTSYASLLEGEKENAFEGNAAALQICGSSGTRVPGDPLSITERTGVSIFQPKALE